jgi:hypothetical protein
MRTFILAAVFIMAVSSGARATLWWRDKIASLWTPRPLSMDGGEEPWARSTETDEASVIFRAMNDSSDLYLLITPDGSDGKGLITGKYRQDAALWFLAPDMKTRAWGLHVPYSRLDQLAPGMTPAPGAEPEFLTMQGAQVSTSPLPGDIAFHLERDGRRPLIEIRIALKNFPSANGKAIPLDFATSAVPPAAAEKIMNEKPKAHSASSGGGRHGGGRHSGHQSGAPGAAAQTPTVPDPLDIKLSVKLASPPI